MDYRAPSYFETFGHVPNWVAHKSNSWILLHPDVASKAGSSLSESGFSLVECERNVVPTASARTVQFQAPLGQRGDYVKLHYSGVLGRVNRELPRKKAIAGPEISLEIASALRRGAFPPQLSIFEETGARILRSVSKSEHEIGMIARSGEPLANAGNNPVHIWPLFSLFSKDRLCPDDPPLLEQLMDEAGDKTSFLLSNLLVPIVDSYFSLVSELGIQPEWNAQNLLVGLDKEFSVTSIIMRDFSRIEKDLPIRKSLGLPILFDSSPYKCIDQTMSLYQVRHSFAFDFKLCEYSISPIIQMAINPASQRTLTGEFRTHVARWINRLPPDYFPKGAWFDHDRIILTGERPYRERPGPKYR